MEEEKANQSMMESMGMGDVGFSSYTPNGFVDDAQCPADGSQGFMAPQPKTGEVDHTGTIVGALTCLGCCALGWMCCCGNEVDEKGQRNWFLTINKWLCCWQFYMCCPCCLMPCR
jgi:hypothetical protein